MEILSPDPQCGWKQKGSERQLFCHEREYRKNFAPDIDRAYTSWACGAALTFSLVTRRGKRQYVAQRTQATFADAKRFVRPLCYVEKQP